MAGNKTAYINARLIDPASGLDGTGSVLTDEKTILDFGTNIIDNESNQGIKIVDCEGKCLAPGLVDMRIEIGNLTATVGAAVAGGITSAVCLPNTDPVIDDMSVVEFVARRARKQGKTKVYPYGAVTKGLKGLELAELGLSLIHI